jgi:3-hydroxybutyryl-CoA dehydrogenase
MLERYDLENSDTVAVVGGGTMGVGIAYVFAAAGWPTTVVEPSDERAAVVRATLESVAAQGAARGKLTLDQAQVIPASVQRVSAVGELPVGLSVVIESVPERFELKQQVLREIEARQPKLIATNTSALSIDALASSLADPTRFVGMHFFNPVWSLPMIEIIRGASSSETAVARAAQIAEAIGKQTITVTDTPGFATSRLDLIASLEAMRMLEDGVASANDIDRAMLIAYRHPIGPLRLSDIVGLDVRLDIARNLATALGPRYTPPLILESLVAEGHLGQKTGRGFFDWPTDISSAPSGNTSRGTP